ncbi:MAG TPA: threonine synthase, partial [Pseudonocardiaceae bacterium]|nr:threonine synthase [Pseudonocardiaceae bacterium]
MTGTLDTRTALNLGPARHLVCRECGSSTPLAAEFACAECFGPLEVGYDFGSVTHKEIEAGPPSIWRYRGLLPVPNDVDEYPNMQPGLT